MLFNPNLKMNGIKKLLLILFISGTCLSAAQVAAQDLQADNMLLFQRSSGGWYKQFKGKSFNYNREFTADEKSVVADEVKAGAATIDNGATCKEIRYLVKAYQEIKNPLYLEAAEKGIRYLLKAQYANGGFPQYYPDKGLYRNQITFNDNAMINAMKILSDVALKENGFDIVNPKLVEPSTKAVSSGIDCILKTQIKVNGQLTAWCQQYDEVTLQPAKARSYELPSISASESVGIIEFLMAQKNVSTAMKSSIDAAIGWLKVVKIEGYKFESPLSANANEKKDRQLIADATAPTMWARCYEIETNKPFFCDRDGIVKYAVAEIGYERRNGYAWYGKWPENLLVKTYPKWFKLHEN
jgi:PelA/Pel-15E family pectate lyase